MKRFLIYEYDVNLSEVMAESEEDAIALWCSVHKYKYPAGLWAQEIPLCILKKDLTSAGL